MTNRLKLVCEMTGANQLQVKSPDIQLIQDHVHSMSNSFHFLIFAAYVNCLKICMGVW